MPTSARPGMDPRLVDVDGDGLIDKFTIINTIDQPSKLLFKPNPVHNPGNAYEPPSVTYQDTGCTLVFEFAVECVATLIDGDPADWKKRAFNVELTSIDHTSDMHLVNEKFPQSFTPTNAFNSADGKSTTFYVNGTVTYVYLPEGSLGTDEDAPPLAMTGIFIADYAWEKSLKIKLDYQFRSYSYALPFTTDVLSGINWIHVNDDAITT